MFRKDYAYKVMEKENKRLTVENQTLRDKLDEVDSLKTQYGELIIEMQGYKEKYKTELHNMERMEWQLRRELEKIVNEK